MKKALLLLLVTGLLAVSAVACAGSGITPAATEVNQPEVVTVPEEETDVIVDDGSDIIFDDTEIILPGEGEDHNVDTTVPAYFSVTGKVVSVEEVDGLIRVEIEDTDGNPAYLILSEETVFPFDKEFAIGDEVTGWYLTDRPMIMIWPTEYTIAVLVANAPEGVNIRVNRFYTWEDNTEGYLLSQEGDFAFRTDENTEIILASGDDFSDGDIDGRRIVVIYGISTRSIPEMTTADKLIVLFEDIMPIS